jgi:RND family efflux transporter MFP subunit
MRKRRHNRKILLIASVAVAVVGAAATFVLMPKPKPTPAAEANKPADQNTQLVTVVRAEPREFVRTALVSGQVRPVADVNVYATATGVRISDVLVDIGDMVEEGQPLAKLDSGVADAQILAAQAQYQEAKIEQARAAEEYARVKPIADTGALSKEEIETRRAAAAAADARLAAQKAAFEQVKARLQGGYVRAPAAGLVIERNAKIGEVADQKALFRIVGGNRLEVAAAVSEKDIQSLKAGQSATFTTGDGDKVKATLRRPAVAIDPQKGTGEALFDLPADTTVRTGMYLRGEVELEKDAFIAAPQTAISYATGEPSLFVIKDGKAILTPVTLGARNGNFVAITSGVAAGDKIAASGGAFLLDGDSVRIAEPQAPKSGAVADVSHG